MTGQRPSARKRRHLRLVDPADGAELLPDRRRYTSPLTRWSVELETDDPTSAEYTAAFRSDGDDNDAPVVFTLSLPGTSLYMLRVSLGASGEVAYESHIPLVVQMHPRKKLLTIRLLATVQVVPDGVAVTYRA